MLRLIANYSRIMTWPNHGLITGIKLFDYDVIVYFHRKSARAGIDSSPILIQD